nr:PhoP/PhoQ regulator MgrB [Providencia sp. M-27]
MFGRKLIIAVSAVLACIFFYLLAMDNLCDQGGENFIFGICRVTDLLPFWICFLMLNPWYWIGVTILRYHFAMWWKK